MESDGEEGEGHRQNLALLAIRVADACMRRRGGLRAEFKTRRKAMQCARAVMNNRHWRFEYRRMAVYIYMRHHMRDRDGDLTIHAARMSQGLYCEGDAPSQDD